MFNVFVFLLFLIIVWNLTRYTVVCLPVRLSLSRFVLWASLPDTNEWVNERWQIVHAVSSLGRYTRRRPSCRRHLRHVDAAGTRLRHQWHVQCTPVISEPLRPELRLPAGRRRPRSVSQSVVWEDTQPRSEPFRCRSTFQRVLASRRRQGESSAEFAVQPLTSPADIRTSTAAGSFFWLLDHINFVCLWYVSRFGFQTVTASYSHRCKNVVQIKNIKNCKKNVTR